MKTNIFIRVKDKEISNAKYIQKEIGNFKDKKVLYLGPGDGFYIEYLDMNNQSELVCIEINKDFCLKLKKKGIKYHNQNFLEPIVSYKNYFDIVFSFSFVQYINPNYIKQFNDLCRFYLKDKESFALHLSIPNSKKFLKNINYSYINNKINLKALLINYFYFYFKKRRFEINFKSYWHNPREIEISGGQNIKISDVDYRFQYCLFK